MRMDNGPRRRKIKKVTSAPRVAPTPSKNPQQITGPRPAPITKKTAPVVRSLKRSAKREQAEVKDTKGSADLNRAKAFKPKKHSGLAAIDLTGASGPLAAVQDKSSRAGINLAKGLTLAADISPAKFLPGGEKAKKTYKKIAGNAVKDMVNLPAGTVPAAYLTGRAGLKAIKGDSKELKGVFKEFKEHDPIALSVQGKFKKAGKETIAHPGFTAIELAGVKGIGGRLAGKAPGVKPRSSRPNLKDPKSGFEVERAYSPDLTTRGIQKLADKKMSSKRKEKLIKKGMEERIDQLADVGKGTQDSKFAKKQAFKEMGIKEKSLKSGQEKTTLPDTASKRLEQHRKIDDPDYGIKPMRQVTSAFSRSVLPSSPTWYAGNVTEGALRTGLQKAGPLSARKFKKTVKELEKTDPDAARELRHASGHGQGKMLEEHLERESPEPIKKVKGKKVWDATIKVTDKAFEANQKFIETPALKAVMGKSMKQLGYTAKDMKNPAKRAKIIKEAQRHYGQYSAFSPNKRKGKGSYAPFVAWPINAGKFLARLPEDHPLFSATSTANNRAQDKTLKKEGLRAGEKNSKDMWELGSIPTKKGTINLSRYTPFGAGIDPVRTAGSGLVPTLRPIIDASSGRNWKGYKIKSITGSKKPTPVDEAAYALGEYGKSLIPGGGTAYRVAKGGPKELNPFKPYKGTAKKKKKASGNVFDSTSSSKNVFD